MAAVQGPVLCLAQLDVFLFSGGQDTTIKVWKFDATAQAFQPMVCLLALRSVSDNTSCHAHIACVS